MELKLGAAIKDLRLERNVTQHELAEYIGVSFQAVSKWETDTTMPDIALLPKLAVFFGVRIDDLFRINTDDELERIDFMLANEKLTDEGFRYAKNTLDSILRGNEKDTGAMKRYAQLYFQKNQRDRLAAGQILRNAMSISPADDEIYWLYRQVCGGDAYIVRSGNDDFIRDCEPYSKKYPENTRLTALLIEAMLAMGYLERAAEMVEIYEQQAGSAAAVMFKGDIALAQGDVETAKAIWLSVDAKDHKGQYEVGERFNRICAYTTAIAAYENSFAAAPMPRDLSAVYSLAFLYTKLGKNEKAIEMWQRILAVLASDWKITDGETAAWPRREIEKLKNTMA